MSVFYRNSNTDEILERDAPVARLELLDNWDRFDTREEAEQAGAQPALAVNDGVLHRPGMGVAQLGGRRRRRAKANAPAPAGPAPVEDDPEPFELVEEMDPADVAAADDEGERPAPRPRRR
jgi:hypothetical protein